MHAVLFYELTAPAKWQRMGIMGVRRVLGLNDRNREREREFDNVIEKCIADCKIKKTNSVFVLLY